MDSDDRKGEGEGPLGGDDEWDDDPVNDAALGAETKRRKAPVVGLLTGLGLVAIIVGYCIVGAVVERKHIERIVLGFEDSIQFRATGPYEFLARMEASEWPRLKVRDVRVRGAFRSTFTRRPRPFGATVTDKRGRRFAMIVGEYRQDGVLVAHVVWDPHRVTELLVDSPDYATPVVTTAIMREPDGPSGSSEDSIVYRNLIDYREDYFAREP